MAWLIAVDGEHKGRRFPLTAPCLVGRGPYNHVVLDDTRISRQHAKISPEKQGHVVYDLNSANGTYVNEVQVKRQRLEPNDVLRFGPFRFRFEDEEPTSVEEIYGAGGDKFLEVRTFVGSQPSASILDSLDAKLASDVHHHVAAAGLMELEEADRKLRTLYGFLQSIASTLDAQELLERVVANVLAIFPRAESAAAYQPDVDNVRMEPRTVLARGGGVAPQTGPLPPQFHDEVVTKRKSTLSTPRPIRADRPRGEMNMHAPMIFGDVVHGVLHVRSGGGDEDVPFGQGDLDLLTGLAAQAGMLLQNARMHQESLRQQRLQQDLLLAEQIQKSFLPQALPSVEGLEFITEYRPAYSVGGDFYDVFWLGPERLGMFIGDVSGKGVSAALLMARVSSDLRLAAAADAEPARVLTRVNRMLLERGQTDTFVTVVFLTLDVRSGKIRLSNAGHPPPLLRRRVRGQLDPIEGGGGTALGFFDDAIFEEVELALGGGDTLLLYTDGVLEAASTTGEMFGAERLADSAGSGSSRASELAARVLRDLRAHVGPAAPNDDVTLLVCGAADLIAAERRRRRDEPTQETKALR